MEIKLACDKVVTLCNSVLVCELICHPLAKTLIIESRNQ